MPEGSTRKPQLNRETHAEVRISNSSRMRQTNPALAAVVELMEAVQEVRTLDSNLLQGLKPVEATNRFVIHEATSSSSNSSRKQLPQVTPLCNPIRTMLNRSLKINRLHRLSSSNNPYLLELKPSKLRNTCSSRIK